MRLLPMALLPDDDFLDCKIVSEALSVRDRTQKCKKEVQIKLGH
jgi:hypothetical protein